MIRVLMILGLVVGGAGAGSGAKTPAHESGFFAAPRPVLEADKPGDDSRKIDKSSSRIEFHAKATFAKIIGVFHAWEADLKMPGGAFDGATLHLKLESESVGTGSGLKDKEIKGKNFFNVKEFPDIEFVPSKVTPGPDPSKFVMEGNLTIRGITKPVTVMITVHPEVEGHQMIDGEIAFNRRDFGMTHNVPFNKVANEVEVEMHLNVVSNSATPATAAPATVN
jgi:polyisoprenoid-binding protein YceI